MHAGGGRYASTGVVRDELDEIWGLPMTGFEWFLLIVVVILVPLLIAVIVTLWTLEQARKRNRRNRPGGKQSGVARKAMRAEPGPLIEGQSGNRSVEPREGRPRDDHTLDPDRPNVDQDDDAEVGNKRQ